MTSPADPVTELTVSLRDLEPLIKTILTAGTRFAFRPHGGSMEPFLHNGKEKIILVRPTDADYRRGDIILYQRANGDFVLHRILGRRKDGFILCGDAQTVREYGVPMDRILARVEKFYRGHRLIDCRRNLGYRLLSALWMSCRPIRRWLMILRHPVQKASSLFRRLRTRDSQTRRKKP